MEVQESLNAIQTYRSNERLDELWANKGSVGARRTSVTTRNRAVVSVRGSRWTNVATVSQANLQIITDRRLFKSLCKQWLKERGVTSSAVKMSMCSSYQRIIGMGMRALPFILEELRAEAKDPDHWFWALEMITGTDPIPEEHYGNTVRMAEAWLSWAEEQDGLEHGERMNFQTLVQIITS